MCFGKILNKIPPEGWLIGYIAGCVADGSSPVS